MFWSEIKVYFFDNVTGAEQKGGIVLICIFMWAFSSSY